MSGQLQLESGAFGGSRIVASQGSTTTYTPNYFLTDHLGSVRVVWDGSSAKRSDYYPFGGRWTSSGTQAGVSRFQYNGKEAQNKLANGLNYLDYGARMYDSRIGRWHSIYLASEDYYSTSPYMYCTGNPTYFFDLLGERGVPYINKVEYRGNGWDYLRSLENGLRSLVNNTIIALANSAVKTYDVRACLEISKQALIASEGMSGYVQELGKDFERMGEGLVHRAIKTRVC